MAFGKEKTTIMSIGTLAAGSTVPANPGGTECTVIDADIASSFALTLEGTFSVAGTVEAHIRTSPVGGTDPADWDTQDYTSFNLAVDAAGRGQITKGIWADAYYFTVQLVNPGTVAVNNVYVYSVLQNVEPN